jgi:HSP20 family molecular chaperone IbpA
MFFTGKNLDKLDKLVDDIFNNNVSNLSPLFKSTITNFTNIPWEFPDVEKTDDGVLIKFKFPGYEREDLEISIQDRELTIKTKEGVDDSLDVFKRSFELFEDIDIDTGNAEMKAGILKLTFQYKKEKKAKKITIN